MTSGSIYRPVLQHTSTQRHLEGAGPGAGRKAAVAVGAAGKEGRDAGQVSQHTRKKVLPSLLQAQHSRLVYMQHIRVLQLQGTGLKTGRVGTV